MTHGDFIGRTETRHDVLDQRLVEGLAATLGVPTPGLEVPPLWHWMLFQDWQRPDGIGPDGHPRRGGFLPPVHDLARRMWAGGEVTFFDAFRTGDAVRRVSTIADVVEKSGGSGRLVFVTVLHEIDGPRGRLLSERQDIVYRGAEGAAIKPGPAAAPWPEAVTTPAATDPVTLFRYSALTGNGHRIHYDFPYVTQVEGYPGLVVHGPLQATWLAAHALRIAGDGARLRHFSYRGKRPSIGDRPLTLLGARDGDRIRLETRDEQGCTCQSAEATMA